MWRITLPNTVKVRRKRQWRYLPHRGEWSLAGRTRRLWTGLCDETAEVRTVEAERYRSLKWRQHSPHDNTYCTYSNSFHETCAQNQQSTHQNTHSITSPYTNTPKLCMQQWKKQPSQCTSNCVSTCMSFRQIMYWVVNMYSLTGERDVVQTSSYDQIQRVQTAILFKHNNNSNNNNNNNNNAALYIRFIM